MAGNNRWARLASMSGHELFDRLRQRAAARADVLRYRLGLGFAGDIRTSEVQPGPRFFFASEDVAALVALLKQRWPRQAEEIVQRAERICQHRFDLLGYEDLDYGAEIDWHCDRVHGKRAPRKPWFQVRYLDFKEAGDVKVTWELNRHQHLVTLAKAYRLTGAERFAAEIFRQWRHWHAENPYPIGVNWASSLEVAWRSLSWLWVYFLLGEGAAPPEFRGEWLRALAVSGRHIERYLSTYFSPNTHLLGEAIGLFFIGTLCPELRSAGRWQQRGWEIVLREAKRQVQADGLHFEQSTYYHVYALDFFLHARLLAAANGILVPEEFDRTLEKMLEALCLLGRTGVPPRFGDDDGGRLFDPRRNGDEHLLDPLATGAALFGRRDFKALAGELHEEALWLLGERGVAAWDQVEASPPDQNSAALEAGGLYLMASAEPTQLVLDAGPQGALTAGHGHADALSLCASGRGRALLLDPGTCEYVGSGAERNLFRSTSAHNTLQVDGRDQAEPNGPFAWVALPNVKTELWISGEGFDLFAGSHDGYCRLERPVVHRRWVFSLKSRFWLVRDMAVGEGEHRLDLHWHLAPELKARTGGNLVFLAEDGNGLGMATTVGHGWSQELQRGWWSPVYGQKQAAEVLHFSTVANLPVEFVTLLRPLQQANTEPGALALMGGEAVAGVRGYRYCTEAEESCMFFARRGQAWTLGACASDAEFVCWSTQRGRGRSQLIFCNGSYVDLGGRRIVTCRRPVVRCEVGTRDGQVEVFSSDNECVQVQHSLDSVAAELEAISRGSGPRGTGK